MTQPMSAALRVLLAATALLLLPFVSAQAGDQLAVGEVIPLQSPPGYEIRPVYTQPVLSSRWTPTDNSFGQVFREPVYTAPPGYVYRYVRGYSAVRVIEPGARPVRRHAARTSRGSSCVTELGYGHYSECR